MRHSAEASTLGVAARRCPSVTPTDVFAPPSLFLDTRFTMTANMPLRRFLTASILSLLVALSVVDARASRSFAASPGWCKFSTAIKHQDNASQHWRTTSDDARLIASRRKKQTKQIDQIPEQREPTVVEQVLLGGFIIGGTTVMEYVSGFIGGFCLGTICGVPGMVYSKEGLKMGQRFSNMNARSMRWAKTWAPISAVFGGCDAATRIIRNNKKDQWNTIISSAAAGAYFSRAGMFGIFVEYKVPISVFLVMRLSHPMPLFVLFIKGGPAAMLRGAAVYGGFTYVLSGGLFKQNKFEYKEEAVEF